MFLGPVDVTQIAANFVSNKAEVIIRMRGLPFHTKEADVVSFHHIILFLPVLYCQLGLTTVIITIQALVTKLLTSNVVLNLGKLFLTIS